MEVKIKCDHWYPKLCKSLAITVYPYIFVAGKEASDTLLKHELHHIEQVRRTGWLNFYVSYALFYLAGLLRYRSHSEAYSLNPYEVEAYDVENELLTDAERKAIDRARV